MVLHTCTVYMHVVTQLMFLTLIPQDPATRLGRGGAGAVYKGRYRGNVVAVKEFLTASQAEHTGDTVGAHGGYEEDDLITQADAMFLFRYKFVHVHVHCRVYT